MGTPLENTFSRIANSIRSVDGTTELISTDDMPNRILNFIDPNKITYLTPIYYGAAAKEVANVAESYVRAWSAGIKEFTYSDKTPLDGVINTNGYAAIDSATLIGLILRGYSYSISPYNTEENTCNLPNIKDGNIWKNEEDLPLWSSFDLDNQDIDKFKNGIIRSASDLALFMWLSGRCILDITDLKVGDIVFFTTTGSNTFKQITHVGIMYKDNIILSIKAAKDNPTDVSFEFIYKDDNDIPFDSIAFCARPNYSGNYTLPAYSSSTNRLKGPWVGFNKIDPTVASFNSNYETSIEFIFNNIPTGDGFIFELYDEDICNIELEPGTYQLSGCPSSSAGKLIMQQIEDYSIIHEDTGYGIIFRVNETSHFKAYIQISKEIGFDGYEYTWTPTLIRTA